MIGLEVNRGRRSIRRAEVLSFDASAWTAYVTLDGSLSAVSLPVGEWVSGVILHQGARVAVMHFDETNPADGVIVGAYGGTPPSLEGWFHPTHYAADMLNLTWAADAPFDDAPSTAEVTTYPGLLRLINDDITEDHFLYKSVSGSVVDLMGLVTKGVYSYIGVRIDDGDDNDYTEMRLVDSASYTGQFRAQVTKRVGGGSVTTAYVYDPLPPGFYVIRVQYSDSADAVYTYLTKDSPLPVFSYGASGMTWTAARAGLTFGQRSSPSAGNLAGLAAWLKYA